MHVTLDLDGRARFGPDVEWMDRIDYTVDPPRAERFYAAIRRYWPGLPMARWSRTTRASAPKSRPGTPCCGLRRQGPRAHGVPGLVNLFGIESPGLTASLPLGDAVIGQLNDEGPAFS